MSSAFIHEKKEKLKSQSEPRTHFITGQALHMCPRLNFPLEEKRKKEKAPRVREELSVPHFTTY